MNLAEKLKDNRQKNKLTQDQIAKKLHVSRKTISSWETGRNTPDITTLKKICSIYNLNLTSLLSDDNDASELSNKKNKHKNIKKSIHKCSYVINVLLLLLSFLNFFIPYGHRLIWVTPLLIINILVYRQTYPNWKNKINVLLKSKETYITIFIFILITLPIAIPADSNLLYEKNYISAFIIGIAIHEISMAFSLVLTLYLHD